MRRRKWQRVVGALQGEGGWRWVNEPKRGLVGMEILSAKRRGETSFIALGAQAPPGALHHQQPQLDHRSLTPLHTVAHRGFSASAAQRQPACPGTAFESMAAHHQGQRNCDALPSRHGL